MRWLAVALVGCYTSSSPAVVAPVATAPQPAAPSPKPPPELRALDTIVRLLDTPKIDAMWTAPGRYGFVRFSKLGLRIDFGGARHDLTRTVKIEPDRAATAFDHRAKTRAVLAALAAVLDLVFDRHAIATRFQFWLVKPGLLEIAPRHGEWGAISSVTLYFESDGRLVRSCAYERDTELGCVWLSLHETLTSDRILGLEDFPAASYAMAPPTTSLKP